MDAITSSGTSSARSSSGSSFAATCRAHAVASAPSTFPARARQSAVRSASEWTSFSGLVERVAWARSFMIVAGDGRRPCAST